MHLETQNKQKNLRRKKTNRQEKRTINIKKLDRHTWFIEEKRVI